MRLRHSRCNIAVERTTATWIFRNLLNCFTLPDVQLALPKERKQARFLGFRSFISTSFCFLTYLIPNAEMCDQRSKLLNLALSGATTQSRIWIPLATTTIRARTTTKTTTARTTMKARKTSDAGVATLTLSNGKTTKHMKHCFALCYIIFGIWNI